MAMQNVNFDSAFSYFLEREKPKRILEIGTSHGGLTLFLRDKLDELGLPDSEIISYDIQKVGTHDRINKLNNVEIRIENIFSDSYLQLKNKDDIEKFINDKGRTVVLCDGGSKKNELKLIAPLLKAGDFILAHDYAPDKLYHEQKMKQDVWKWCEITDADIKLDVLKLEKAYFVNFINAAWGCFRKTRA